MSPPLSRMHPTDSRLVYVARARRSGPVPSYLLRSEGGGDLVVAVADAILGPGGRIRLREMQAAMEVSACGRLVDETAASLARGRRSSGGTAPIRANRSNLANWCSPRSLRTEDEQDFLAIMRAVGLES